MKFNQRNVQISASARIGQHVRIGDNTVIYDNVWVDDGAVIANDCVIGEPTRDYYSSESYTNAETRIGKNALIRSHAIIYAGAQIGEGVETGHRISVREESIIGKHCKIGSLSDLQGHLSIGDYSWLHSNVHICQYSDIGNYVFLYPFVVLTNDKHPPSDSLVGPSIGDYTQVGVHSVIMAGISLGENCLVGSNSTVTKSYINCSLIIGSPAKRIGDVREIKSENGEQLYPWSARFSRGMPWSV